MINSQEFKYEQSTLSKFDIIGSYFVNLYYNEFYTKANTLRINGSYNNITDAYRNILSSYLDFIKKPEFFKQIVKGIHAYCISTTKYTTMSHKECIDFMISEFIPQKLWSSIRENQKNKLFHESINNSITIFTADIITNHLIMIIDNHSHPENITILQDLFLKIILLEKDKVYSKFLNPDNNNMISTELFKTKLMELVNEKKETNLENIKLKKIIEQLKHLMEKNSNIILELQKKNKTLLEEKNKSVLQFKELLHDNSNLMKKNKTILEENVKDKPQLKEIVYEVKNIPSSYKEKIIINTPLKGNKEQNIKKDVHYAKELKSKLKNEENDIYSNLLDDDDENSSNSDTDSEDNNMTKEVFKKSNKTNLITNKISKIDKNTDPTCELEFGDNSDYY